MAYGIGVIVYCFAKPVFLLGPWLWADGSYELRSFCWSFHLLILLYERFLGIGSLVFFLNFGIEAPSGFVHDSRIFWKKILPPKWAENRIFWIYEKIWSLIFSEFGLSWNLCFLLRSCPNSISEKNLVLEI